MYENFTLQELKQGINSTKKGIYLSLVAFSLMVGAWGMTATSKDFKDEDLRVRYRINKLNKFSTLGISLSGLTALFYDAKRKNLQEKLENGE